MSTINSIGLVRVRNRAVLYSMAVLLLYFGNRNLYQCYGILIVVIGL